MRLSAYALAVIVLLTGCREQPSQTENKTPPSVSTSKQTAPATPLASQQPQAELSFDPEAPPVPVESGPLRVQPPILEHNERRDGPTLVVHPWVMGWNAESTAYASCASVGSMEMSRCRFVDTAGKRWQKDFDEVYSGAPDDPKRRRAQETQRGFKARQSHRGSEWPFGAAISLEWRASHASVDGARARFELLAHVLGEPTATVVDRKVIEPDNPYIWLQPQGLALSPDGKFIGITLHTFSGEWTDKHHNFVWSAAEIAARAYNNAGMTHHQAGRYKQATQLFHRAAHTGSLSEKAAFNLACALARLGDPAAKAALKMALVRGGQSVAAKAQSDPDLATLRAEDWFQALLAEHQRPTR